MELRHLRYFVMVAEEENVSRAAARLNVSQPAVSRQIHDLEDELGVTLFQRQRIGLSLTTAGHTAFIQAKEVLRQAGTLTELMRPFQNESETRTLKIGYLPTALPGFLAEGLRLFNQDHKEVCVQIFEMSPCDQEKALRSGEIDLALLGQARPELKKEFTIEPIRKSPIAIALPNTHSLAQRKSIDLADLADDPFITLTEKRFPGRPQMMKSLFERAKINPRIVIEAAGLSELLGLVGSGAGVALIPEDLNQLPHQNVVFVKLRRPTHTLTFSGVWNKKSQSKEIPNMLSLLKQNK